MKKRAALVIGFGFLASELLVGGAAHAQVAGSPVTFSDSDFNNWSLFSDSVPNGTVSGSTIAQGDQPGVGNTDDAPDGYLAVTTQMGCAIPSDATGAWYDGTHQPNLQTFMLAAPGITWDPVANGPVFGVDYKVDVRMTAVPGTPLTDGFSVQAYVEQNGYHYTAPMHFACMNHEGQTCLSWSTITGSFTLAGGATCDPNFEADGAACVQPFGTLKQPFVDGTPVSPDFSGTGAPLRFGIDLALSGGQPCTQTNPDGTPNLAGDPAAHYLGFVDNFSVTITPARFVETFDATALSEPTLRIYSQASSSYVLPIDQSSTAPPTTSQVSYALAPGQYTFITAAGRFEFTVGNDGSLSYPAASPEYRSVAYDAKAMSSTLTIAGFTYTIDATALSEPFFDLLGLGVSERYGPYDVTLPQKVTLIPGEGAETLFETGGGDFPFYVGNDGQLHFDPNNTPGYAFIDGAGTTLTVEGVTFGYQSNLSEPAVDLIGLHLSVAFGGTSSSGQLVTLTALPGDYLFRAAGGTFVFTVGPEGALSYAFDPTQGDPDFRTIDPDLNILYIDGFPFRVALPDPTDQFDVIGYVRSEAFGQSTGCECLNLLPGDPGSYAVRHTVSGAAVADPFSINSDDSSTVLGGDETITPSPTSCDVEPACVPTCASVGCEQGCATDASGTPTCDCDPGYDLAADGKTCDAIKACETDSPCAASQAGVVTSTCTDTGPGTYSCACNAGFSGDGKTCVWNDPCTTTPNGSCDVHVTCTSTFPNPYSICPTCPSGYTGNGQANTCLPINACATNRGGCSANATCTNTGPDTNSCACEAGYSGNGQTCTAINNCATNNGGCSAYATCTNTGPGTNSCACEAGYSGNGQTCTAINNCATNNGGCSAYATCTDTGPAMNTCACEAGYSGNGQTCAPINNCATNHGGCSASATCTNTGPGTNSCTCEAGYSGNGQTCTAINSCATNNGGCSANATCTDTGPGTNTCACEVGYSGDGKTCTDTTPPTVIITSPMPGVNLYTASGGALVGTASDSGSGVASASFTIDGTISVAASNTGGNVWTGASSFHLASLSYGSHTVTLTAVDHAGNSATSAPVTFVIAAPPTVVFVTPQNGAEVSGSEDIVADATGHGYNIAKVVLTATSASGTQTATCVPSTPGSPIRCTWSQLNVTNFCPALLKLNVLGIGVNLGATSCSLTLTAIATDTAGQTGSATSQVTIEPPTTVIVGVTAVNKLSLTVTNHNLSFTRVQCSVSGAPLPLTVSVAGTATMIAAPLPAGPLLVVCNWTNSAGTVETDAVTFPNPAGGVGVTGLTPIVDVQAVVH